MQGISFNNHGEKTPLLEEKKLEAPIANIFVKNIKIKDLMQEGKSENGALVKLQVQHAEVEQQQQNQNAEEVAEVVMEVNLAQQEAYALYDGELVNQEKFGGQPYLGIVTSLKPYGFYMVENRRLIQSELFGNLPKAIKFMSEAAAIEVARNLPSYSTLNQDNLPQGFSLKQTKAGELVLDYDMYAEEHKTNIFTPKPYKNLSSSDPIYPVNLDEKTLEAAVNNSKFFDLVFKSYDRQLDQKVFNEAVPLKNMWIRYGYEGIRYFFSAINELFAKNPDFIQVIYGYYLKNFPNWDHFLETPDFLNTLKIIGNYDATKLRILVKFLGRTSSSCHDLNDTIAAFEYFWEKVTVLFEKNKVDISQLASRNWYTPEGGNPIVYMERMLTIFNNARDINEQVEEFGTLHKILGVAYDNTTYRDPGYLLSNYGGYYASKYEGYKLISLDMKLVYDAEKQDKKMFNPNALYYAINLAELTEQVNKRKLSSEIETLSYRIIGQQAQSIKLQDFKNDLALYYENWVGTPPDRTNEILVALFFISHERYQRKLTATRILKVSELATNDPYVVSNLTQGLLALRNQDIKISDDECEGLLCPLGDLNSAWFDGQSLNKATHLDKIFAYLKKNKYGGLKALKHYCIIQGIDSALFLEQDPIIATAFRDNLLLFAGLLNSKEKYRANIYPRHRDNKQALEEKNTQTLEKLKTVKEFLHHAASDAQPNNYYHAYQLIADNAKDFDYDMLLQACAQIKMLTKFDAQAVMNILIQCNFKLNQDNVTVDFVRDNSDLKNTLVMILMFMKRMEVPGTTVTNIINVELPEDIASAYAAELEGKSIKELQVVYNNVLKNSGFMLSTLASGFISHALSNLKDSYIDQSFDALPNNDFKKLIQQGVRLLPEFAGPYTFEKVNQIAEQSQNISGLLATMMGSISFNKNLKALSVYFDRLPYSSITYATLYSLLSVLCKLQNRDYEFILPALLANPTDIQNPAKFAAILSQIENFHSAQLPSHYIKDLIPFLSQNIDAPEIHNIVGQIRVIFAKNPDDKNLGFVIQRLAELVLNPAQANKLLNILSVSADAAKDKILNLLKVLQQQNKLSSILELLNKDSVSNSLLVTILARAAQHSQNKDVDYANLISDLSHVSDKDVREIDIFTSQSMMGLQALKSCLNAIKNNLSLEQFLITFEKAPFGVRDLKRQFDVSMVERVVNDSKDSRNQSKYPLQYRKQLMEAFLFVNKAGSSLPIYYNKPAKDLSNKEIKALFNALKNGDLPELDKTFNRNLYALGLMRESIYRATGKFPYSTQMLALIDCMMHGGDVISGIDCGQGKSLIDVMKASLLWLNSDRVDLTTSSLVDAERDIQVFSPYFESLGIPYSKNAISAATAFENFQTQGINFSTFSQLSLFFHRAKAQGFEVDKNVERISLVANESDHAILDDRTVFRYALMNSAGVNGNEWVYDAINQYIDNCDVELTLNQAAQDLKTHLAKHAVINNRSPKIIKRFDNEQLTTWLKSAISAKTHLRENFDYVIPAEQEMCFVDGVMQSTRVIKILSKDGKVSPDTTYGDGIQQFLYARLNKKYPHADVPFVIQPESQTIISTNNKNLLDYYRSKQGYIWGSSGTVGSDAEIRKQYEKYGFEFSKIEPHQKYIVATHKPAILADENKHFNAIYRRVKKIKNKKQNNGLVFFKDIETAKRFFDYLQAQDPVRFADSSQLFLGTGNEVEVVKQAAKPGMITITTSALGRNTDVLYDKKVGMKIIQTYVDTHRATEQKSRRTGREGSPGEVFFILNREDLGGRSVEDVKQAIEHKTESERDFNEELYDVLGYLFASLQHLNAEYLQVTSLHAFLKLKWATFSDERENAYRDARLHHHYDKALFTAETVRLFNLMLQDAIKAENLVGVSLEQLQADLAKRHLADRPYLDSKKLVIMADCMPAEVIASHFMTQVNFEEAKAPNKNDIKLQLKTLFSSKANKLASNNQTYIQYLNRNAGDLGVVREAHQEFLGDFLQQKTVKAKRGFFKRWLGFQSDLNKIADDKNYLLLFKAMSSIPGQKPLVKHEQIRDAVVALLREYLASSWFISQRREFEVRTLIHNLTIAQSTQELVRTLMESRMIMIKSDIEENKKFMRFFRPVNKDGSRAQVMIDKALSLASALTGDNVVPNAVSELSQELKSISKNPEVLDTSMRESYERSLLWLNVKDKANAKVLKDSLDKNLKRDEFYTSPQGMFGRKVKYVVPDVVIKDKDFKK